jgi:hypothetical protein
VKVSNEYLRSLIRQRLPVRVIQEKTKLDERSLFNRCRALRIDFAQYKYDSDRGFKSNPAGQVVSKNPTPQTKEAARERDRPRGDLAGISTLARNGYTVEQISDITGQNETAIVLVGHRHGLNFVGMSLQEMESIVAKHHESVAADQERAAKLWEASKVEEKSVAEHLADEDKRITEAYRTLPEHVRATISRRHAGIERWCAKNWAGKETEKRMKDNARKEETRRFLRQQKMIQEAVT